MVSFLSNHQLFSECSTCTCTQHLTTQAQCILSSVWWLLSPCLYGWRIFSFYLVCTWRLCVWDGHINIFLPIWGFSQHNFGCLLDVKPTVKWIECFLQAWLLKDIHCIRTCTCIENDWKLFTRSFLKELMLLIMLLKWQWCKCTWYAIY